MILQVLGHGHGTTKRQHEVDQIEGKYQERSRDGRPADTFFQSPPFITEEQPAVAKKQSYDVRPENKSRGENDCHLLVRWY